MECTKLNCPMQVGTVTEICGDSCPWRTTVKLNDLISRAAALNAIDCWHIDFNSMDGAKVQTDCWRTIKELPAVDVKPVVHGRWTEKRWTTDYDWGLINHRALVCTACGVGIADGEETPYCSNCGAKMDGE